ncbi:MAG: LD-carboxypeptidase, partial [Candidatus Dadabacteria bacterium]
DKGGEESSFNLFFFFVRSIFPKVKKQVRGEIIGGNLSVIASLIGTPLEPQWKDTLLFIEETNEPPYRIHRMLTQLKFSKKFRSLSAVVLGDLINCDHKKKKGPTSLDVVKSFCKELAIPLFTGAPFGHGARNFPFPLGRTAIIYTEEGKIVLPRMCTARTKR